MRRSPSLFAGVLLGSLVATTALPFGIRPVDLTLSFSVILFAYSTVSILYFSTVGWPRKSSQFDFYDLNKIIMAVVLSGILVSFFTAFTWKVASVFSLNFIYAAVIGGVSLAFYIAFGCMLWGLARRERL